MTPAPAEAERSIKSAAEPTNKNGNAALGLFLSKQSPLFYILIMRGIFNGYACTIRKHIPRNRYL